MNQLDVYYRALLKYRSYTTASTECSSLRTAISEADAENDKIVLTRAFCTIDEEWVDAIEKGLVHIEKAIKEDRQFIRSNGEVIPIEKVKHVSKDSVVHLARHSNLITRFEEGEEVTPEKLFVVERLNDYAVYENRFLYMLLCYLRDFITIRYNDIVEITNKYDTEIDFKKRIVSGRESINYTLSMHDVRRDDPYLRNSNPQRSTIDRIALILKTVMVFLATPLMEEVAKVPMLHPPITKTNVLKMNNNFKGAMALFDYIIAYTKPGYTIETKVQTISPLNNDMADEMAEAGALVSFLAYQYNLGLKGELKESYLKEEERLRREEIKQRNEYIAVLKKRLETSGEGLEEYIVTLEKNLRDLNAEAARAEALSAKIEEYKEIEKQLGLTIDGLNKNIEHLKEEAEAERIRFFEETEALKEAHNNAMHDLMIKHEGEIAELNEKHAIAIEEERAIARAEAERHAKEVGEIREQAAAAITDAEQRASAAIETAQQNAALAIENARQTADARVKDAEDRAALDRAALEENKQQLETVTEQKRLCEARLKSHLGSEKDLTDRDNFNELEEEYNAFTRFYKEQWAKTKQKIRKKHLNIKNFKGQGDDN